MPAFVALPGSHKSPLPNERVAGAADLSEIASLTVRLRSVGQPDDLVKKVYALAITPLSQRQYLTRDELAKQHGASQEDFDTIEQYAQRHGLTVVRRRVIGRSVVLQGPLGSLLNAFPADVQLYHHASGTYRGHTGHISLPQELSGIVTGVIGYDTRPMYRNPHRKVGTAKFATPIDDRTALADDMVFPTAYATHYNFPQGYDGEGQTIALIELGGGFAWDDVAAYFDTVGSDYPLIQAVSVDGTVNNPGKDKEADFEVILDIEVAGSVAPKALIAVYFAANGPQGMLEAIDQVIIDAELNPAVVSISWGFPEAFVDQQTITAFHESFSHAGTMGITVCSASGDHGCAEQDAKEWNQNIHVDFPSCDEFVLACGGTQTDEVSLDDVVWNDGTSFNKAEGDGGGWASGGGISVIFPVPLYQEGINAVDSIDTLENGRGVPDLAMNAVDYYCRYDGQDMSAKGTSAVAPLMAALVARINQAKGTNVGFLNPYLYKNASKIFTAVTVGNNAIGNGNLDANNCPGYPAGRGWNACTGLGIPDGTAMLNNLT